MTKTKDQPESPDPVGEAVAGTNLSAEATEDFVLKNRFSPQREAAMKAYREQARQVYTPSPSQFVPADVATGAMFQPPPGGPGVVQFDVLNSTIAEAEVFLDDHDDQPELVAAALEAEQASESPRKGMVEMLERRQRALDDAD